MMMNISQPTIELAHHFRQIAIEELMSRHLTPKAGIITRHTDGSFVTEADWAAERRLIDAAKLTHPHAVATGEEKISEDPRPFLQAAKNIDVWIFDPLDGTGAFMDGLDIYANMGAYIRRGVTEAGIIYCPGFAKRNADGNIIQPLIPDKDVLIVVERGKGCWLITGNDWANARQIKIGTRAHSLSDAARVAFACRNQDAKFEDILAKNVAGYMTRRHANNDYIRLLTGEADATFYAEGFMPNGVGKCPPWDHAAGVLAVQEAGGYVGLPYGTVGRGGQIYNPLQCHSSLLVAANRPLFDDMMLHVNSRAPQLMMAR